MAEIPSFGEHVIGGVRLVLGRLDSSAAVEPLLTDEERSNALKFKHPAVRARHIVSRYLRRRLLAGCTGRNGADLRFTEGEQTKPRFVDGDGWDFNTSHAGDFVAVCAAPFAVGVDIEEVRAVPEMERIVTRYFHADEAAAWQELPPDSRESGFFVLWSAREAAMKCAGLGLGSGMEITRVDPVLLDALEAPARVGEFQVNLFKLGAPPGYVMFVAAGL